MVLLGTEAKAIREGRVNLRDSYARIDRGEVWAHNIHISSYSHRGYADHDSRRPRKLLLHKQEIRKLMGKTVEKGMTLVPLRMYFKNGRVKLAISLAKGRRTQARSSNAEASETGRRWQTTLENCR
jgi:SsrA-binding protein